MPLPLAIKSDQVFGRKSLGLKNELAEGLEIEKTVEKTEKIWLEEP